MTRPRGSGFLASFSGTIACGDLFALCAALPRSQSPAVFDELGYPPLSAFGQGSAPPVVILPAPRWPAPQEADLPVNVEAAINVIERALEIEDFVLPPRLAVRIGALRERLLDLPYRLTESNENRPVIEGDA